MRSPGAINPLTFSSEEDLKKELRRQGEERGWTPMEFDEDGELKHYGVKGMKWGVRKDAPKAAPPPAAPPQKKSKAKKIAVGTLVIVGAAAATAALARGGKVPISPSSPTVAAGKAAVSSFDKSAWTQSVSSLSKDIAEANASQDAWMRSLGLGHIVNNRVGL